MPRRSSPCRRAVLASLGAVAGALALASEPDTPELPIVRARLVSSSSAIEPGGADWIALHLAIRHEDWHVYWKNPGDSGTPPRLSWTLPPGVEVSEIEWPAPHRFLVPPLASYGYESEVYLPQLLSVAPEVAAEGPLRLEARASWLACKVECIPESADLSLELQLVPEGTAAKPTPDAERIAAALDTVPVPSPHPAHLADQDDETLRLVLPLETPPDLARFDYLYLPSSGGLIEPAAPQQAESVEGALSLRLVKSTINTEPVHQLEGVLIAQAKEAGGWEPRALSFTTASDADRAEAAARARPERPTLAFALSLAFAGGVLLNLMPCVFPVLAIKVLSFARAAAASRAKSTLHALVFAAGILVSFWALAALLLALRAGGEEIGWGFQLQSPPFVLALAFLFFAMGLLFLGVMELGSGVMRFAGRLQQGRGYAGSFWSGVLATAVATPCTGPYMGVALGYALTAPPHVALLVFTALALGMGLPYVALASSPGLLRRLPKPGPWMETLRQLMAFPLLATVVWLLWVFAQQAGPDAVAVALGGMLFAAFGMWLAGRVSATGDPKRARWAVAIAMAAGVAGFAWSWPGERPRTATAAEEEAGGLAWIPYTPERLEAERGRGRPIYLDFTASWCLTCQVNKRVVFSSDEVLEAFRRHGVILMRADWTDRDPAITRALASFGRSGVPLNVLYGDEPAEEPVVLSTVLTPSRVLDALEAITER